jgi:pre-mRNA-splicing factor ATP-dependent RNA helicase DHX15/PRP43
MNKGIFDPDGIHKNPLNDKKYSDEYKTISKLWCNLPAYKKAFEILETIKNNEVILIQSGTGSGKSVIIPKISIHLLNYKGLTIMTLPKKDITKSSAVFSSKISDTEIGEYIGYQYRGEQIKSDKTILLYSTDGSIISMIKKDPLIMSIDILIIDEAHERKIQIDLLLYLIKKAISERKNKKLKPLKLIIMSATINADLFIEYYKDFNFKYLNLHGDSNYPIKSIFLKNSIFNIKNSYIDEGIKIIKKINDDENNKGDILFFVCSISECIETTKKLYDIISDCFIMALYSGYPKENNIYITNPLEYKNINKDYKRRIFISTNVAESSLTINNIIYVIDSGLEINIYYNSKKLVNELSKTQISHSQIIQRKGRAGRTQEGVCYHLYTEQEMNDSVKYPKPEIKLIDLKNICLAFMQIKYVNNKNVVKKDVIEIFDKLIEPPEKEYVLKSFDILEKYEIIKDDKLTNIGLCIAETNLDINDGLTLLYAYQFNQPFFNKILLIICICVNLKKDIDTFFYNDVDKNIKDKIIKKNKTKKECYFSFLLNIFNYIKDSETTDIFNRFNMIEIKKFYNKYKYSLYEVYKSHDLKIKHKNESDDEKNIMNCFNYGFRENIALKHKNNFYYNNMQCNMDKNIFSYKNTKEIIFYTTLLYQGRLKILITQKNI